jgi:hypothetical protein
MGRMDVKQELRHLRPSGFFVRLQEAVSLSQPVSLMVPRAAAVNPHFTKEIGASGLRIGESSSATKPYGDAEEFPDADTV